ncbi:MAG: hypothetical protein AAF732_21780 [Pseudomonadota bacterium]
MDLSIDIDKYYPAVNDDTAEIGDKLIDRRELVAWNGQNMGVTSNGAPAH